MFSLQAIPSMLLALVLCFDHRKSRDSVNLIDINSAKGHKYIWYALTGYAIGLVTALAAGVLTHSPQPALLYLVLFLFKTFMLLSLSSLMVSSANVFAIMKFQCKFIFLCSW
jgi:hypothetical protein